MKFLVTGINGFAAPYLARLLVEEGHEVWGLARQAPKKNIHQVHYIIGDMYLIDAKATRLLQEREFDGVFNLAASTHPPSSFVDPAYYFTNNALGTINLAEVFGDSCVFMQCSTPEVYGICPEKEIFENFPLRPMNPYGVSKAAADMYVMERMRNDKMKGFITRAGSHTGAGRPACYSISSDAIQIAKILKGKQPPVIQVGNLSSQRGVTAVEDVVKAYYGLMLAYMQDKVSNGEVFHISTTTLHTMEYYLDFMLDLFGVVAEKIVDEKLVRKIDIPVQILDSSKLRNRIGWHPTIPLEETLRSLVNYWMVTI